MKLSSILLALFTLTACTENVRARGYGGTAKLEAHAGHKVIGVTWKATDLWILTRPMELGEEPTTLILQESSSWGMLEGKVVIHEVDSQETAHARAEDQRRMDAFQDAYDKAAR